MFADDGWRFPLDAFPAAASSAGPIKTVLGLALPKAILGNGSFEELTAPGRDYQQAIFRLPLRRTVGAGSADEHGPVFPGASFPNATDRDELLREMCEEAKRSLLFLKSLRRVVFGGIVERRFDEWARVEATRRPPSEMVRFAKDVDRMKDLREQSRRVECRGVAPRVKSWTFTRETDSKPVEVSVTPAGEIRGRLTGTAAAVRYAVALLPSEPEPDDALEVAATPRQRAN
jgi:hypothetical protein